MSTRASLVAQFSKVKVKQRYQKIQSSYVLYVSIIDTKTNLPVSVITKPRYTMGLVRCSLGQGKCAVYDPCEIAFAGTSYH